MTSNTSFGPDQMEEGVHAWTSPCNPDPLKPGVKLMAGCNSAGVGVTSVSLPVVNSYVSKTCDKGVKGRRMLLCRVELCVTEMSASRHILMIYIKLLALLLVKGNIRTISPGRNRCNCQILAHLLTIDLLYGTGCLSY